MYVTRISASLPIKYKVPAIYISTQRKMGAAAEFWQSKPSKSM